MLVYRVEQGCTVCGMCLAVCPTGAIRVTPRGAVIDESSCARCGECYRGCASEAITETEEEA